MPAIESAAVITLSSTGARLRGNSDLDSSSTMFFRGNSMISQLPPPTSFPEGIVPVAGILSGEFSPPIGNDLYGNPVFTLQSRSTMSLDAAALLEA